MIKKLFIVMMMLMSISYTVNAEIIKEGKTYSQVTKTKTPDKDSGFTYKDSKGNIALRQSSGKRAHSFHQLFC